MPIGLFSEKPSTIRSWLSVKGFNGSFHNALLQYFSSISTLSNGTLYDHINESLSILGYTGTLRDKLAAFFIDKTGISDRRDAERNFFSSNTNSFNGLLNEDGRQLLNEDGSSLLIN